MCPKMRSTNCLLPPPFLLVCHFNPHTFFTTKFFKDLNVVFFLKVRSYIAMDTKTAYCLIESHCCINPPATNSPQQMHHLVLLE